MRLFATRIIDGDLSECVCVFVGEANLGFLVGVCILLLDWDSERRWGGLSLH